jgi:hypothetical protein
LVAASETPAHALARRTRAALKRRAELAGRDPRRSPAGFITSAAYVEGRPKRPRCWPTLAPSKVFGVSRHPLVADVDENAVLHGIDILRICLVVWVGAQCGQLKDTYGPRGRWLKMKNPALLAE